MATLQVKQGKPCAQKRLLGTTGSCQKRMTSDAASLENSLPCAAVGQSSGLHWPSKHRLSLLSAQARQGLRHESHSQYIQWRRYLVCTSGRVLARRGTSVPACPWRTVGRSEGCPPSPAQHAHGHTDTLCVLATHTLGVRRCVVTQYFFQPCRATPLALSTRKVCTSPPQGLSSHPPCPTHWHPGVDTPKSSH